MKKKESRIRFVPSDSSSLFAVNRPFHAILKDTKDPRIKKLVVDEPGMERASREGGTVYADVPADVYQGLKRLAESSHKSMSAIVEELLTQRLANPQAPAATPGTDTPSGPLDFIIFNVISASVLILDSYYEQEAHLPPAAREKTFRLIHHTLSTLTELKRGDHGGMASPEGRERLLGILEDLEQFRLIAGQEERALLQEREHGGR